MTDLDAVLVRLDAARQMIAAAVRLAEGAADLLIEAGADIKRTPSIPPSTVAGNVDPRASIPSSRLRD